MGDGAAGITGTTRLAALIGWPARHSLSPTILNRAFEATGQDWRFLVFEVPPERGADAVASVKTLGLGGLSVTMPHKATASRAVDARTAAAEALDAVNCVFWNGDRLTGDNTDGAGFIDALWIDHGIDVAGMRCAVVGAGGAGRAVIRALAEAGASDVTVVNRTPRRAEQAAALAGPVGRVGAMDAVAGADLVVNATPIGMGDDPGLPFDPEPLHAEQVVADLIYFPLTTPLLAAAKERGARTVDGLGMLVHQAAHAFSRWTEAPAPVEAMAEAARSELDRRAGRGASTTPSGARLDEHPPRGAT